MSLYKFSKSKHKMIINTTFKEFQKKTTYISCGAVLSPTQRSDFIRHVNITECNGHKFLPGQLREYDLKPFHWRTKELMKDINLTNVIAYEFKLNGVFLFAFITDRKGMIMRETPITKKKHLDAFNVVSAIITNEEKRYYHG